jgi:hypothetical protein
MVDDLVKPLRETVAQSAQETAAERRRADEFLLHSKVSEAFSKVGGKPNAVDFVVGLAKENFEVKDSAVVAKTGKFSTEKPGDALSLNEWLDGLPKQHDYVFNPSNGGGAPVLKGSNVRPGPKPGQTILKNPTPQQLGEYSADIAAGKVRIEHDTVTH